MEGHPPWHKGRKMKTASSMASGRGDEDGVLHGPPQGTSCSGPWPATPTRTRSDHNAASKRGERICARKRGRYLVGLEDVGEEGVERAVGVG